MSIMLSVLAAATTSLPADPVALSKLAGTCAHFPAELVAKMEVPHVDSSAKFFLEEKGVLVEVMADGTCGSTVPITLMKNDPLDTLPPNVTISIEGRTRDGARFTSSGVFYQDGQSIMLIFVRGWLVIPPKLNGRREIKAAPKEPTG